MFCPKCGTQNEDTAKYCKNCGNALIDSQSQQPVPATRTQLPGVACHYPGCTEPVIGQCPGYKGSCLRYYCATHSIEPYCSVCADKILRDAAIRAMYQDYLEAAKKIPSAIGCGWALVLALLVLPCSFWAGGVFSTNRWEANTVAIYTVMAIGAGIIFFLMWSTNRQKQRRVAEIAAEKPGFKEFFAEYEKQKKSESMATVLTGLLVAGAAANAIQNYQMRQDIHEIVKRMKS
jgi:hypothetical protein